MNKIQTSISKCRICGNKAQNKTWVSDKLEVDKKNKSNFS
ncbi:hypothetical protein [uncultured Gammaproteobacteria bacterium]|jgi:hypothetical protein|nr:hypothetical protein [uncultured Gammaproteobacteria bacterium]CAC9999150.1 hypothetical protein [uncultured Gammaproteobacteria bacterium]